MRNHLGAGQRNPAQFQGEQAAHGIDVEIVVEFHAVQLAEVFDRQPRRNAEMFVAQVFYRRRLGLVVLVGDLADDFLQHVFDADQAGYRAVLVDQKSHVVAVALHFAQQRIQAAWSPARTPPDASLAPR